MFLAGFWVWKYIVSSAGKYCVDQNPLPIISSTEFFLLWREGIPTAIVNATSQGFFLFHDDNHCNRPS